MIFKGQLIMANTSQLHEILNSKKELKTELLQPAMKAAVDAGLIPKMASLDDTIDNWSKVQSVIEVFLKTAENKVG